MDASFFSKLQSTDLSFSLFSSKPADASVENTISVPNPQTPQTRNQKNQAIDKNQKNQNNHLPSNVSKSELESSNAPLAQVVKISLSGGECMGAAIRVSGVPEARPGKLSWFRVPTGGQLEELSVVGEVYWAGKKDLGARICAQWMAEDMEVSSNFAQLGPLQFKVEENDESKDDAQERLQTVMAENEEAMMVIEKLKTNLANTQRKLDEGQLELSRKENEVNNQLETCLKENSDLKNELGKGQIMLQKVISERDVCMGDMNTMKITLKSISDEVVKLTAQLENLKVDLATVRAEKYSLENELQGIHSKNIEANQLKMCGCRLSVLYTQIGGAEFTKSSAGKKQNNRLIK